MKIFTTLSILLPLLVTGGCYHFFFIPELEHRELCMKKCAPYPEAGNVRVCVCDLTKRVVK